VYSITTVPEKNIEAGGSITVLFPSDMSMTATSLTTCKVTASGVTTSLNDCTIDASSPPQVSIPSAFSTAYSGNGADGVVVQIGPIINPRSTAPSDSLTVSLKDASGYDIETIDSGVTAQMDTPATIASFDLSPSDTTNGAANTYTVTLIAVTPMEDDDYVLMTFPSEIGVSATLDCSHSTNLDGIACSSPDQETVTAVLNFDNSGIDSGESFKYTIKTITNPPSTEPSSIFTDVYLMTTDGYQIAKYPDTYTITNSAPATITTYELSQYDEDYATDTVYEIKYTTETSYASGAAWKLTVATVVDVPSSTFDECNILFSSITYSMDCTYSSSLSTIKMITGDVAVPAISAGEEVTI
jgi:hypothetical protein